MDATYGLGRRPDSWWLLIWTPVGCRRGVQIGVVWRIGRHLRAGAASRFELYGGLDASYGLGWRPDSWWLLIWTPVGCRRGVQIGDLEWTPLQYLTGVQSKLISSSGRLQSYKEASTTFPLIGCEGLSPLFYAHKRGFCTEEAPFATFQS